MNIHRTIRVPRRKILGALLLLAGINSANAATGTIIGHSADGQANSDGTTSLTTATYGRVGASSGLRHSLIHVFEIPSAIIADHSQQFSAATYGVKLGSGPVMTKNSDLYALGYDDTPAIAGSDFYAGPLDTANDLLQDNFITPTTPANSVLSHSSAGLVSYLNGVLAAARADGATTAYAFLRHSLDDTIWSGTYLIGMNEAGGVIAPTLNWTTVTVSNWRTVPYGGGGYVTGLASDPSGTNIYCRTDVGGVLRWIPTGDAQGNGSWLPLTDKIVPFTTEKATALLCVESIAVDQNVADRVYIAVGFSSIPGSPRGIYVSENKGENWTLIPGTDNFAIRGNGSPARAYGERLAIDPNDSNILWSGSVTTGLRKIVKTGPTTWTVTQIAASQVPYGNDPEGITFVACDKNGSGPTILYAGVFEATTGGIYRSTDGGLNWLPVGGAAVRVPRRGQVAPDGTLYVTAGQSGVFKMPRGGSLSLTSAPLNHPTVTNPVPPVSYRGLAIDPSDASGNTVYAAGAGIKTTGEETGPLVLRSTDGGLNWAIQSTFFNGGTAGTPGRVRKEPDGMRSMAGYWFGNTSSLLVSPTNPSELWLGDYFGVSRTRNAHEIGLNPGAWWNTLQKNQEETVVLAAKNAPTGPQLMTGMADVGGARYLNTTVRPDGAGGSLFGNPDEGNVTSLDFSEANHNVWARAWVASNKGSGTGAVSSDGGLNWATFGQVDAKVVTNAATGGWETFDITPYLKARKAANQPAVTLVLRASTNVATNTRLSFSSKDGTNPPEVVVNGVTYALDADARVWDGGSAINYGTDPELRAQNYFNQTSRQQWSYLRIDLGSLPATINTATLRLYRLSATDTNALQAMLYATPDVSWVESTITWATRPTNLVTVPSVLTTKGGGRVAVSATDPNNLVWVAIKPNSNVLPAYYSKDRGVTWTASSGGPDSQITGVYTNSGSVDSCGQPLAADRGNGYFYQAFFGGPDGKSHVIHRSTDGGVTWSQVASVPNGTPSVGTYNRRSPQLIAAPVSPLCPSGGDVWLCDDNVVNGTSSAGGLWRSTNSGQDWVKLTTMGRVSAIGFGKAESGPGYTVFVHGYRNNIKGVYRSDDYGDNWIKLADPTVKAVLNLTGDRQNFGKVFLGTDGRGTFVGQ